MWRYSDESPPSNMTQFEILCVYSDGFGFSAKSISILHEIRTTGVKMFKYKQSSIAISRTESGELFPSFDLGGSRGFAASSTPVHFPAGSGGCVETHYELHSYIRSDENNMFLFCIIR